MTCDLKIRLHEVNGEQTLDPDLRERLMSFAGHRDICDQCTKAYTSKGRGGSYCVTGDLILKDILEHPDVTIINAKP